MKYKIVIGGILAAVSISAHAENISKECASYIGVSIDKIDTLFDDKSISKSANMLNKSNLPDREAMERITEPYYLKTFLWENDALGNAGRVDEHYTNGMKWSWLYNPCRHEGEFQRKVIGRIVDEDKYEIFSGASFGMNMYTPKDIESTVRNRNDRPYVGWVYYGLVASAIKRDDKDVKSAHTMEIQLGVSGPKAAQGRIQSWWHDDMGASNHSPSGWHHQTDNRLGLNVLWTSRWNKYYDSGKVRLTPHVGASIGNVTNFLSAGGFVSYGNPKDDYPSLTIQPTLIGDMSEGFWYVFGGFDARAIASSIFVEGYGDVQHDIEMENFVYDAMAGISWRPKGWQTKMSWMIVKRSKEFTSPDKSMEGSHNIGQLSFIRGF